MGLGANIQNTVTKVITDLGTEITIFDVTPISDGRGFITGYTLNSSGTVKAVPSSNVKLGLQNRPFGKLNEGEIRMLFPASTAYTGLIGTASDWRASMAIDNFMGTYRPKTETPIILQGLVMAYPVVLVLESESGY